MGRAPGQGLWCPGKEEGHQPGHKGRPGEQPGWARPGGGQACSRPLPLTGPTRPTPADHAQATRSPTQTLTPHQSRPPTPSKEDPVPPAGARPPWNRSTRPPRLVPRFPSHSTTPTHPSKPTHNTTSSAKLPGLPTICRPEQARAVRRPPDVGRGAGRGSCRTPGSGGRRPGREGGGLASAAAGTGLPPLPLHC